MSRAERLLELIQLLRRNRYPITGAELASELDISVRTLYRDIASLQAQGARIDGEPGMGYMLRPGFLLPPLMFSEEEIEALVVGSRWVADRGDSELAGAARNAIAKIAAVLPADLRDQLDANSLLVPPGSQVSDDEASDETLAALRQAIRRERKVAIRYRNTAGNETERTIWPFALAYFERARVVASWCEVRADYRHFRVDRMGGVTVLDERYPRRRQALLAEWREREKIPEGKSTITTDKN